MRHSNIWDKSSPDRQTLIRNCEAGCMQIVSELVREGQAMGDLPTLERMSPEEMVFGLWTALGIIDPIRSTRIHCCQLLNGFGWQPIHSVEEYLGMVDELSAEFHPQFEQIQREYR
jgi:hypothetical protein